MDIKTITARNRDAWNEAVTYHQKARKNELLEGFAHPDFTTFNRHCDDVLIKKLQSLHLSEKTISQLPCNNGRELLSLMRFGAKEAVGFDISDVAIAEARKLAEISQLNASFERVDVLEIGQHYNDMFDFIYISEGSLQWFPDLNDYFHVVARLLKKGGNILIYEMHPFAYFFEQGADLDDIIIDDMISYFEKGPYSYKNGLDYVGETKYEAKPCCWFMHKFSDILNAIIANGITIQDINEYNEDMASNAVTKQNKFPLSYILTGRKH